MRPYIALYLFLLSLMVALATALFGAVFLSPFYDGTWSANIVRAHIGFFVAAGLCIASVVCLFSGKPRLPHANDA